MRGGQTWVTHALPVAVITVWCNMEHSWGQAVVSFVHFITVSIQVLCAYVTGGM